jgi:hypothetical protein
MKVYTDVNKLFCTKNILTKTNQETLTYLSKAYFNPKLHNFFQEK